MIRGGLSSADFQAFKKDLLGNITYEMEIQILDQNEDVIGSLTKELDPEIEDGQVDFDWSADVKRSAQIRVYDPDYSLVLEGATPSVKGLFVDRFLAIAYLIWSPSLSRWTKWPIFWGPLSEFGRDGEMVEVSAQNKEALYIAPMTNFRPMHFKKRRQIDDALKTLLRHFGERRFNFPRNFKKRLQKAVSVPRHVDVWPIAERMAQALNMSLSYDGLGRATLDRRGGNAVATLRLYGDNAMIKTHPKVSYNWSGLINCVEAFGAKPRTGLSKKDKLNINTANHDDLMRLPTVGDVTATNIIQYRNNHKRFSNLRQLLKVTGITTADFKEMKPLISLKGKKPRRPHVKEFAPRAHPLSPWSLGRNGDPRFYPAKLENNHWKTQKETKRGARRYIDHRLSIHQNFDYTMLLDPTLEPGDRVRSEIEEGTFVEHILVRGSFPFTPEADMTVGSHRYMRPRRVKKR